MGRICLHPERQIENLSSESKLKPGAFLKSLALDQLPVERAKRSLLRDALRPDQQRDLAFRRLLTPC